MSSGVAAPQLNAQHIARMEKIAAAGFTFTSFPLYAAAVGVKKGNCAALLNPLPDGSLKFFAEPCYLVEGNLACESNAQATAFSSGRKKNWKRRQNAWLSWQRSAPNFRSCSRDI